MKKPGMHVLSYPAALVIGAIFFAVIWRWMVGSASSGIVTSGIAGVVVAVILFLLWNGFEKPNDAG